MIIKMITKKSQNYLFVNVEKHINMRLDYHFIKKNVIIKKEKIKKFI